MTAIKIASMVRNRTSSVREIVAATIVRISERNEELNAFTAVFSERALARAAVLDASIAVGNDPGPLAGVPFAAKNLFDVAGVVTRAGAEVTAHDPPAACDAELIAALECAGAVLVGVTNMDEFAYGFVTENGHDGATHNPHDLTRIAGGSSGGSAAAVAADLVPLAIGSDTNGSIRIPAALCGIFGLRPTYGTIPVRGAFPLANSLDTVGPFARTSADLRAAFSAISPVFKPFEASIDGLRVARLGGYFEHGTTPSVRHALDAVCAALGAADVVEFAHAREAREAAFIVTAAEAGALHAGRLREHGPAYDPATRDRLVAGALVPAEWYVRAQRLRTFFRTEVEASFAAHDVFIAAATPFPATPIGALSLLIDGVETDIRATIGAYTQPITFAGVPAITVPVVRHGELPAGVQLIGRPNSEPLLIALAEELERRGVVGAGATAVAA
jgi:AtzE family amidohydrolase